MKIGLINISVCLVALLIVVINPAAGQTPETSCLGKDACLGNTGTAGEDACNGRRACAVNWG
ncbi:MAG: hypothetical protein ACR2QH_01845, partial [Geminicoccaceae bacterium]